MPPVFLCPYFVIARTCEMRKEGIFSGGIVGAGESFPAGLYFRFTDGIRLNK